MARHYLYAFVILLAIAFLSVIGHNWAYTIWGEFSWPSAAFFYLVFIALPLAVISFIIYLVKLVIDWKNKKPLQ